MCFYGYAHIYVTDIQRELREESGPDSAAWRKMSHNIWVGNGSAHISVTISTRSFACFFWLGSAEWAAGDTIWWQIGRVHKALQRVSMRNKSYEEISQWRVKPKPRVSVIHPAVSASCDYPFGAKPSALDDVRNTSSCCGESWPSVGWGAGSWWRLGRGDVLAC